MAIKVNNKDIRVTLGNIPIKSVMLGNKCVLGDNLTLYTIDYPATPVGARFYISVNNKKLVDNPTENGRLGVAEGDNVVIRTYACANYMNPYSRVKGDIGEIIGDNYSINLGNDISVERATIYTFNAMSNCKLEINEAEPAKKIIIPIIKDEGVQYVNYKYNSSPLTEEFSSNKSFSSSNRSRQTSADYIEVEYGSRIYDNAFTAHYNEGYKQSAINVSYVGVLTYDNQSQVTINSTKGKVVSITCPALTTGVVSYQITMVSSEFSRKLSTTEIVYEGSSEVKVINSRIYRDNSNGKFTLMLYEGDVIKISANRQDGYKLPIIGKNGNISNNVRYKEIILEDDNTEIVVLPGEKGVPVILENNPLSSGEYAYLRVESEYYDRIYYRERYPKIYVNDTIRIDLDASSRVGTITNRKPGVGLSNGDVVLVPITFTSMVEYKILPSDKKICVLLEKGAERIVTTEFKPSSALLVMDDDKTYSKNNEHGFYGDIVPVKDFGEENYYINTLRLIFYTKRYTTDVFDKEFNRHDYVNIPSPFSYSCNSSTLGKINNVLAGNYTISDNKSGVTMTITKYNRLWVANTKQQVSLYAHEIIV